MRRERIARVVVLCGMALIACRTAAASQVFVKGSASATYFLKRVPAWLTIGTHTTNGYSLERGLPDWEGRLRLKVTVNADVMLSRAPFEVREEQVPSYYKEFLESEVGVPVGAKPFKKLASDLVRGCKYESDAVEAILTWIGENVTYDNSSKDEDPFLVYEKRRGQCVGLANLALTLLRSAGIPARAVQGFILTPDGAEGSETRMDFQLHRFIEVYYPDLGWIFSDPQKTVNFVSTAYLYWRPLAFAAPGNGKLDVDGLQIYRAKDEGGLLEEDFRAGEQPARVFVRKNLDLRYSAAIEGLVQTPEGKPLARGRITILSSSGQTPQEVRPDGAFSFVGLKGGEYSLQFSDDTYRYIGQKFKLKDRESRQFTITVERVASGQR